MSVRLGMVLVLLGLIGCSRGKKRAESIELTKDVRLKEDRSKFDKLRKNVPEETQEINDELSFVLNLFADQNQSPSQIQSKFNQAANRKRDEISKSDRKTREQYSRSEKERREEFLGNLKRERETTNTKGMSTTERSRFFSSQDANRRNFFADESDSRREFESNLRQKRQDFEAHMRDVRAQFDDEYKKYSKTYHERKREQSSPTQSVGKPPARFIPPGFTEQDMKDLETLPNNGKPIEPGESE